MMYFGGHMSAWGWIAAMVGMAAFWGVVVVLAMAAYRTWTGGGAGGPEGRPEPAADARRILAERFARGEIDEDEYRSRLAALESRSAVAGQPR